MDLPEERFCSLSNLVKLWNKSEVELCQWAEGGHFRFWIRINHWLKRGFFKGYVMIPMDEAALFISNEKLLLSEFQGEDGQSLSLPTALHISMMRRIQLAPSPPEVSEILVCRSDLLVKAEEVARMKKDHPELCLICLGTNKEISNHHVPLPAAKDDQPKEDSGNPVKGWKGIALYLRCPPSTAKTRVKDRRWRNKKVVNGGNSPGGVWAWSKALDYIIENPTSTARKKQIVEDKKN